MEVTNCHQSRGLDFVAAFPAAVSRSTLDHPVESSQTVVWGFLLETSAL